MNGEFLAPVFRAYEIGDRSACLELFDENCPAFFAPNERNDYARFLGKNPENYVVCLQADRIVGGYGVDPVDTASSALHWILLSPSAHGHGLGSLIMSRVIGELSRLGHSTLHISASHKSAPFFARFGAVELSTIRDGWGPGMHRVEMQHGQAYGHGVHA
jgi:GNAT superfamily N-acetyltransferase